MKGCGFTGHRFISYDHRRGVRDLVARAVRYAYAQGCRDFYDGGAIGFDLLCADVVISLREELPDIRLVMLLPCIDQDSRWCDADRREYERVVNAADEVVCLAASYYDGCMQARNRELVRRSDMLIAYLGRGQGGTAQTVKMARDRGIEVFNLYPTLDR